MNACFIRRDRVIELLESLRDALKADGWVSGGEHSSAWHETKDGDLPELLKAVELLGTAAQKMKVPYDGLELEGVFKTAIRLAGALERPN